MGRCLTTQIGCAVVFAALAHHYGFTAKLLLACIFTALLWIVAEVDIDFRLVLNALSLPGMVIALCLSPLWPGIGLLGSLGGFACAAVLFGFLQFAGRGALGAGDTKLALLIGAMRGYPAVFTALSIGVILGGLGAVFHLVVLRRGRKESLAYAPYLAAGAVLSFFLEAA
ncbi:MAG: hypothetical protein NVSMB52_14280 [Chloroflexota bacterium]